MTATTELLKPAPLTRPAEQDLRLLMLIRHFEWKLLDLFERGMLNGTTHTCLGQEYVPVSLRTLLRGSDYEFSNHRGHGHYLARYEDPHGLLAEIMGRAGAVCHGVGGSQHILRDRYLSTGVQGQSLPVATGVALALTRTAPDHLACVFVGDGTWGEGAVYEALNMAQLWELPLLVVVEHNGIAQSTPTATQMSGTVAGRAAAFGVAHQRVDAVDPNEIRQQLAEPIERVRRSRLPLVVEFETHRIGPHSKGDDTRPEEALRQVQEQDWYGRYAAQFPDLWQHWDTRMRTFVDQVADEVIARPPADWTDR